MSIEPITGVSVGDIDFDDTQKDSVVEGKQEIVHIRIQQRNGKKCLTLVQGLPEKLNLKKVLQFFKHKFCCNGTIVDDEKSGQKILQMQGDQRVSVADFLESEKIVPKDQIKVHGAH